MHDLTNKVFLQDELLKSIGLDVPGVTAVIKKLRELGLPINEDVFTVEEARAALLPLLKGGEDHA